MATDGLFDYASYILQWNSKRGYNIYPYHKRNPVNKLFGELVFAQKFANKIYRHHGFTKHHIFSYILKKVTKLILAEISILQH